MIYSFFDVGPDARKGLGTYIILDHIIRAARAGLPYVYLGYWVEGSTAHGLGHCGARRPERSPRNRPRPGSSTPSMSTAPLALLEAEELVAVRDAPPRRSRQPGGSVISTSCR